MKVDLTSPVQESLFEHNYKKACALHYGRKNASEDIGTGNFLGHKDDLFILTCDHVARKFFKQPYRRVLLHNGENIKPEHLTLYRHSKRYDLALIKLSSSVNVPDYYTIDDIQYVEDFSKHKTEEYGYYLFGYPCEYVTAKELSRKIESFRYICGIYEDKKCTKYNLYLDYPRKSGNFTTNHASGTMPEVPGMSGAVVLAVLNSSVVGKTGPWHPNKAKIVAIQYKSDSARHLTCTSITNIRKWLQ